MFYEAALKIAIIRPCEVVLKDLGHYGEVGFEKFCNTFYDELQVFSEEHKLNLHMIHMNKKLLGVTTTADYPAGTLNSMCGSMFHIEGLVLQFPVCSSSRLPRSWFKGADTSIMTKFLEYKYSRLLADEDCDLLICIHAALKASNEFLRLLYGQGLWMDVQSAGQAAGHGFDFLQAYNKAAALCWHQALPRFKLQPKLHMLAHVCHQLVEDSRAATCGGVLNPIAYSCQQDEDFVGRISTIVRKQHSRSVNRRVLQKFKLQLAAKW